MSNITFNPGSFLRNQRNFPSDIQALTVELDKSYVDIALKVNARIIGLFATSMTNTGETWYLAGGNTGQQSLRQVYPISDPNLIVAHGINFGSVSTFTRIWGVIFDGTNYYPLPYVDVVAANNQIGLEVTPTNLVVVKGAGSPPAIVSGIVILEWLSLY
jgi:hypothetical protein